MKPILYLALYGTAQHSTPKATGGSVSGIVTIGGTGDPGKRGRGIRLNSPDDGARTLSSTAHGTSQHQLHGDTHPLAALTDNESDSWAELRSHDFEMDQMDQMDLGKRQTEESQHN